MAKEPSASTCSCKASSVKQKKKTRSNSGAATSKAKIIPKTDFLDAFHEAKLCDIPATSPLKIDAFDAFRPASGTVLDYKISQTDTKLERQVKHGVQKFHIKETTARYLPYPPGVTPPPKKKTLLPPGTRFGTGRGPCNKFLDEIWLEKFEIKQEKFRNRLPHIIKQREDQIKEAMLGEHYSLLGRVGPNWFQELSPQQFYSIDNLKNSILKDTKMKTICHTQDTLGELGLVLRPNHNNVRRALMQCCQCPVEFLLILYQLMNKKRKKYSLNDRLMLSAVVHLTMRETLKELHVRIPSPPPPARKPKVRLPRPKPKYYKSPYLIPFTFVPEPRKHNGVYKNTHVQHPESPYFSYKMELLPIEYSRLTEENENTEIRATPKQEGITDEMEDQLIVELELAQTKYNELAQTECIALLHKPSIYIPCDYGIETFGVSETTQTIPANRNNASKKDSSKCASSTGDPGENKTNLSISVAVKVTTDYDECSRPIRSVCECDLNIDERRNDNSRSVYVCTENEDDDLMMNMDSCIQTEYDVEKYGTDETPRKKELVMIDEKGCGFGCLCDQYQQCEDQQEKLIEVGKRFSDECKCKAENEKLLEMNVCQCHNCVFDRAEREKKKKSTFVIGGIRAFPVLNDEEGVGEEGEDEEGENEEGENQEKPQTPSAVRIIDATRQQKICTCLKEYYKKVKKYEEMKKRFDVQRDLLTLNQQYIIGGVTTSPQGEPVYMLSGTVPNYQCPCAKHYKDRVREEQRITNMPKDLPTVPKYVIGGVTAGPDGNVYIISGSKTAEECACMRAYDDYMKKHSLCLQAYDEYMKKTKEDVEAYMAEIEADERYNTGRSPEVKAIEAQTEDDEEGEGIRRLSSRGLDNSCGENSGSMEDSGENTDDSECILQCCKGNKSPKKSVDDNDCILRCCNKEGDNVEIETCLKFRLELNMDDEKNKEENVQSLGASQKKDDPSVSVGEDKRVEAGGKSTGGGGGSKGAQKTSKKKKGSPDRFVIMEKIPCDITEQEEIIKNALEIMAQDGFPLAKLPDCYKLPHFKLWMQMRCHTFWTQRDRIQHDWNCTKEIDPSRAQKLQPKILSAILEKELKIRLLRKSLISWKHTDFCIRKVSVPKLDPVIMLHKYTWKDVVRIRKLVGNLDSMYYRKIRQARIEEGREFLPTMYSYELPTYNFRDCYFAYTPSKEEDVIAWRPWYQFEMKNMRSRKPC